VGGARGCEARDGGQREGNEQVFHECSSRRVER
jgi:hypothetical protein